MLIFLHTFKRLMQIVILCSKNINLTNFTKALLAFQAFINKAYSVFFNIYYYLLNLEFIKQTIKTFQQTQLKSTLQKPFLTYYQSIKPSNHPTFHAIHLLILTSIIFKMLSYKIKKN